MTKPHQEHVRVVLGLIFVLSLLLAILCSVTLAQPPITPSGLNTQVNLAPTPPPGKIQYDITGGTRPGGGVNLFHSFGNFNVPNNNIANFLNDSGLTTSNILGRVTGGNLSNIFGTIQTTGFGNANLFLMNPAGFLFGPNATINVGGMVSFTSADYLRLADGVRFNAMPNASADALLSVAPVAAFGFLGSNPGAITVQGSHLTVAEGTGISLVGGNIAVQGGTLTAPSGQINLVSVGKPSHSHRGGEVANGGEFSATGFKSLGTITLSQGSTVDTSAIANSGRQAGPVSIRAGEFIMQDSSVRATDPSFAQIPVEGGISGGNINITAEHAILDNSGIAASTQGVHSAGNITINVGTFSATDSSVAATAGSEGTGKGGAITIQGLGGPDTHAQAVSLSNSSIFTGAGFGNLGVVEAGPILIKADNITMNHGRLDAGVGIDGNGGLITLESRGHIEMLNSNISVRGHFGIGGVINVEAGRGIDLVNTVLDASSSFVGGGTINMAAPDMSIMGSTLTVGSGGVLPGGTISLTGTKAVSLSNGTVLSADNFFGFNPIGSANGGTILINGGHLFTSHQSTISAGSTGGNGGTIHVEAKKVQLTDTQLTTSVTGGPQTVGGRITVDAEKTTLTNSQLLSTATQGDGGLIGIASPIFHKNAGSVIDASSQTGTNGTVTINGVVQP